MDLNKICIELKQAAANLALRSTEDKNNDLRAVAASLRESRAVIKEANQKDVAQARAKGVPESLISRLELTDSVLDSIENALFTLIAEKDPIGEVVSGWRVPNGLEIRQVRVPLGLAAVIYESRPNVTVDVFSLAYKSSNAILLRGSSSALESNKVLVDCIKKGLRHSGGLSDALALSIPYSTEENSHADVDWILNAVGKIDVVFPRGGAALIKRVVETARVPVIETGAGVCHLYVDHEADTNMALQIAENAKIQRPGVCNALECLLVHEQQAERLLPHLKEIFAKYADKTGRVGGVELRCDQNSFAIFESKGLLSPNIVKATDQDWGYEFLDYILAIKIVDSIEQAIEHINTYNTKHSESIITNSREQARLFQSRVDAACVYVNASTRFTDGGEFGMGAELGISTQKLHVRGPMGLSALTSVKYIIDGEGQTRP